MIFCKEPLKLDILKAFNGVESAIYRLCNVSVSSSGKLCALALCCTKLFVTCLTLQVRVRDSVHWCALVQQCLLTIKSLSLLVHFCMPYASRALYPETKTTSAVFLCKQ